MEQPHLQQDSASGRFSVQVPFALSLILMSLGIWELPVNIWMRGFLCVGLFFTVGATISIAGTMRDDHGAHKLIKRLTDAKTEKILHEYDLKP